jgi:transposase
MLTKNTRDIILALYAQGLSRRHISRLLGCSRNTVNGVIRLGTADVSRLHRPSKLDPYSQIIHHLVTELHGNLRKVRSALADDGTLVSYQALTAFCRRHGIRSSSDPMRTLSAAQQWLTDLFNGKQSMDALRAQLPDATDLGLLLKHIKHGSAQQRKKVATVLARKRGISNRLTAKAINASRNTTKQYYRLYFEGGVDKLFARSTRRRPDVDGSCAVRRVRVLELLHHKPNEFGINRTSWTQPALSRAYHQTYGEHISRRAIVKVIRAQGYRWKKARRVLTSPDPCYREKVEVLLGVLHSLTASEVFFFLDEWGPIQVRKRGGRAYRDTDATIARRQILRGTVSLVGALSAISNQMTWGFIGTKDSAAMLDMIEILYNQHVDKTRLYVTWDAVAWHNSSSLLEDLDRFNEDTRKLATGPIIELVPLPTSSQFLNVIEGVLSGMTRAVVHNSDYESPARMKRAISTHFVERNEFFRENPKRVGKKIWERDFFGDCESLRSGDYCMGSS